MFIETREPQSDAKMLSCRGLEAFHLHRAGRL